MMARPAFAGLIFAALAAVTIANRPAAAQEVYPSKPVRIIVPFPAGGTSDIIVRVFTQQLAERLGQQFVIDNRPGASTLIGSRVVAKSEPDGYTLLLATALIHSESKDFKPIAMLGVTPYFLTVNADVPAKNVSELVAYIKSRKPGEALRYGSSGVGGAPHLGGVQFDLLSGTSSVHVPYKGSNEAIVGLLRNDIQVYFVGLPTTQEHVTSGKLRLLAAAGSKRSSFRPDLPTVDEQGLKGFDTSAWFAIMAPVDIPDDRADKLAAAINAIAATDSAKEALKKAGAETQIMNRKEFAAFMQSDFERWKKVTQAAGIETDTKDK
jgi:tripartite-type tricarboxylate transporter receptor subunit TctC